MAAVAMAASVFAVDFSCGVKMIGDLFNYDGSNVKALQEHHENQFYHIPMAFAISDDKAGGQLKFSNVGADGGNAVTADAWSIWFKPLDALKITVGRWSTNLNQEHIGWCNTDTNIDTDGYALTIGSGAFTADIFLASGNNNYWFTKAKDADAALAELYAKVNYGADFGTINAFINGTSNFKNLRFGAGFNCAGLPVGLWINVIGVYANEKFNRIRAELDVSGAAGSLGYEAFIAGGYFMEADADAYNNNFTGTEGWHVGGSYYIAEPRAFAGLYAKLSFPLAGLGGFVEIKDGDFLADAFAMDITPGFTANVGCCGIKFSLALHAADPFTVSVPVEFDVKF